MTLTDGGVGSLLSTDPAATAARGSAVNSSAVVPVSTTVRRVTSNRIGASGALLDSWSSMIAPCSRGSVRLVAGRHRAYGLVPACFQQEDTRLRPSVFRKVDDDGCRGAAHDHPSKRFELRGVDFHVGQKGGDMNE